MATGMIQVLDCSFIRRNFSFTEKAVSYSFNDNLVLLSDTMKVYQFNRNLGALYMFEIINSQIILICMNMIIFEGGGMRTERDDKITSIEVRGLERQGHITTRCLKLLNPIRLLSKYDYKINTSSMNHLQISDSIVVVDFSGIKHVYQYGIFMKALKHPQEVIVLANGVISNFIDSSCYVLRLIYDNEITYITPTRCYIYQISYQRTYHDRLPTAASEGNTFLDNYGDICLYSTSGNILEANLTTSFDIKSILKYGANLKSSHFLSFKRGIIIYDENTIKIFDTNSSMFRYIQNFTDKVGHCYVEDDFLYVNTKSSAQMFKITADLNLDVGLNIGPGNCRLVSNIFFKDPDVLIFNGPSYIKVGITGQQVMKYTGKYLYYTINEHLHCINIQNLIAKKAKKNFESVEKSFQNGLNLKKCAACENRKQTCKSNSLGVPTTYNYYSDDCSFKFDIKDNLLLLIKDDVVHRSRDNAGGLKYSAKIGPNVLCFYEKYVDIFLIGIKHLILKSRTNYFCSFNLVKIRGCKVFICTKSKSIFKYNLVENSLVLECSDPAYREVCSFYILKQGCILLYEAPGYITMLKQISNTYEVQMRFYAGDVERYCIGNNSCHYKLKNNRIGEIRFVDPHFFDLAYSLMNSPKIIASNYNANVLPNWECGSVFETSMNLKTNSYEEIKYNEIQKLAEFFYQNHRKED